jgi:soluble lytic murein transglycosylase-like protein
MEQLRTDVVTTSSENVVFLKILLLKPGIDKGLARDIAHSLTIRAREHHRDPDLILAIIDIESDFNPSAVSHMGAIGLMQIMPMWIETLAIERDLRDIDTSINYGLKILGTYEKIYGTLEMALTVYNKGPTSTNADLKYGRNPFNGYAESIMRTYSRIKSWARP